jgi:anti-anti-sigma factor
MNLTLTLNGADRSASVRLAGDLDYVTTRQVVEAVSRLLTEQPALRHLHLDCSMLTFCDSAGLSGLLDIHRRVSSAGAQLRLEDLPPHLERLLQITGTLEHLTAPGDGDTASDDDEPADISADSEMAGSRGERNG